MLHSAALKLFLIFFVLISILQRWESFYLVTIAPVKQYCKQNLSESTAVVVLELEFEIALASGVKGFDPTCIPKLVGPEDFNPKTGYILFPVYSIEERH